MHHPRFAVIRRFEAEIRIRRARKIPVRFNVLVRPLDYVMAGGTKRKQFAAVFFRVFQRADGRKPRSDFPLCRGVHRAAALPVFYFRHRYAQQFRGFASRNIQLLCLRFQRATGIITNFHTVSFPCFSFVSMRFPYLFRQAISSGRNTSSNFSAVRKPSDTHASFREMFSLYAFFAVFAAFS